MLRQIIYSILLLSMSWGAQAQCPTIDVNIPDTVCNLQTIQNNTLGNNTYQWDFCSPDLNLPFQQQTVATITGVTGAINAFDIAEDNGNWFGLVISRNNQMFRLNFGNSLDNTPIITALANPSSLLNTPMSVQLIQEGNTWYAFVLNLTGPNHLIRYNFGTSLAGTPSGTAVNIGTHNNPSNIRIYKDNSDYIVVIAGLQGNRITLVSFGNSLANNTVNVLNSPVITGQDFGSINVVKECNTWYGISTTVVSNQVYRLNFGANLFSNPTFTQITSQYPTTSAAFQSEVFYDQNGFQTFILNRTTGVLTRSLAADATSSVTNSATVATFTTGNTQAMTSAYQNGRFYLFVCEQSGAVIRLRSGGTCDASVANSNATNPTFNYTQAGMKRLMLAATDANGNLSRLRKNVFVRSNPYINTNISTIKNCKEQPVLFQTNITNQTGVSLNWQFHDGINSNLYNPSKNYDTAGTYPVILQINDINGCSRTISQNIRIKTTYGKFPHSKFTILSNLCSNATLQFADSSTFTPDTAATDTLISRWFWDFGNGKTSNLQNPTTVYDTAGTYTVTMRATDSSGCGVDTSVTVTIQPGPSVMIGKNNLCLNDTLQLTDNTTFAIGTAFASREWQIQGIDTTNVANPQYLNDTAVVLNVKLTVTNNIGCTTESEDTIRIRPLPLADFTHSSALLTGDTVFFTDNTTAPFQTITQWQWNFGDTTVTTDTSSLQNPKYVFTKEYPHKVQLKVISDFGCEDTVTRILPIRYKCPIGAFSIPSLVSAGQNLPITNNSIGETHRRTWDFCAGDLNNIPYAQTFAQPTSQVVAPRQIEVVQDTTGNWYGFAVSFSTTAAQNRITRFDFKNNLGNPLANNDIIDIGNVNNIMTRITRMRVLRHRRNWYGLAIINTTDNSVNNLVRVAFGNDLANQVPTGSIVATGANRPIDLVTAIHRDTLFALVVSAVNNRIYRLRLDTNANNPVTTEITNPQFNNLEGFQSITLHKVCNEWFAFALADANNKKLYRLSFGNSLSNSPVVRDITFLATQPNGSPLNLQNINVRGVEVAQDGGEHYLFLHTFAGELIRLNFGSTFANNSIIGINFGNIPNFVNVHHFSLLKQASNWYGFGISAATTGVTANQAYRLVFPNNCNASSATDTSKIPQNITYLAAGTYKVSLENYNEFGDVSVVTQNVTVTPVGNLLCNFAQFNAPQFVCAQDTFRPQNTSNTSIAKNYEWDFCAGDLERNPNFQANGTINLTLSGTQNRLFDFFPVYDDVKKMWYAFTVGFDNNDLYRIEYRNGIDNVPTFAQSIGQFGGNATTSSTVFNRPRSIVVFKQNSLWYGLVGNTQNNRILKLNFGTRLDTNNIIIEQFNAPTSPHQLELVNDVKEGWVLLMVGGATPNIGAMWFGKDINNVPVSYIVPNSVNMGGLSSINTISVVRECRNYLAFIGSADGRVLRLNFQGSLLNAPTFTEITGLGFTASTPLDELEAVQEGGTSYLYAMRTVTNGSVGELVRIKFGNSFLNNNPTVSPTLLNVGTRSYGLRFRQQNSRWFAWTVGTGNANLARIDFPNECTATTPAVVNQAKGSIVYNPTIPETPGTRQVITLTAYGENGEVSIFTDSVFVRKPIIANFTFAGNICQGQVITFTNTSQFTVGAIPQSVRWYFGNGDSIVVPNNNPLQNVTYSYPNFGTYKVRLVITDFAGCRSIAERTIIIAPKPTADFIFPAKICSNDSVTFVSTSQAATGKTITQWVWQINGNTVAVGQQPKFVITQTGNVLVTLIVTDDGGCDSSITKTVFVTPGAAVDFTIENACSGDSVIFTNTTNPQGVNISSQTWNVNGVIHTTQNVTQLFPNIGFFSASLLVQNDSGCAVLVTKPFQVRLKPSANISLGQACVNNKIEMELINVITEGTYTAAWNFGDGSPISNELKPTHIYNTAGNYDITATLTTQFGCTNSVSLPTFVEISPTADFSFNNICLGQNAQLSACNESSSNNGSPIGSYSWKLSAGQIIGSSQVCNPPASFAVADTFDVTLRVTNILGCFDTIVKQLIVYPLPQVRFTFDTACVGVPYTFKDSSTVRGQLVQGGSRFWSFGGNAQTVDFTFPSRNVFPVTLTVTSQQGCTSTQTRNITVDNPPVANFNFEAVPTSLQVRFINTSSELGLFPRYAWNFGNGVTSNQRDAVQTFAQEGVYPVSLTVSNNSKCSSTITKDVTVASQARCGVAVEDVIVELRQNRFLIRGRVRNEGNVNVPIVELTAKLANKAILTEQRSVNLLPNGVTDFTLSYQVVNPTVGNFPFICIEAKALNCKNDLDTTNNELCYILESQFQLLDFYPTLANDILRFSYVVPETDNLKIAIYDRTGREVGAFVEEQAQAGVYEKIMNVSNIAHGMYFVRFIYRNQIITRSVVINMR